MSVRTRVTGLAAFIGLDGFVDEILHAVDQRESADRFTRVPTIEHLAKRLASAVRVGTNLELVSAQIKLGGNGPIMANALASFGVPVTYLGALGYPAVHPVFAEFTRKVQAHSIAQPGFTDALEFDDGKVMLNKNESLKEINWSNIEARFGRELFRAEMGKADLVGFVNWTMLPHMSSIWEAIQDTSPLEPNAARRKIFFDLADPQKRSDQDIRHALDLIVRFEKWFEVILGLNEKESIEIGRVLGLETADRSRAGLATLALEINRLVPVNTLVVHPTAYALAVSGGQSDTVDGHFIAKPKITTGAGDHFNAGFCLGRLLGLDNELSLLCGVHTSGYYVRTAESPSINDLIGFIQSCASTPRPDNNHFQNCRLESEVK
jgi:hypothetical protein